MNCKKWEERVALYAGGDLTPTEAASVEMHLAGCAECCKLTAELREQLNLLHAVHAEPIADAHFTALRIRVLSELREVRPAWWRRKWIYVAAVAALVVLAILVEPRRRAETPRRPAVAVRHAPAPAITAENPAVQPVVRHARPRRLVASRAPIGPPEPADPMVIKLMTNDPDVVIYWIGKK